MQVTDITITDFKSLFTRDFPYLPLWATGGFNNSGELAYYDTTRLFYTALKDNVTSTPGTLGDWSKTVDSVDNYIQDDDITRAFSEATATFNPSLFSNDNTLKLAFLYLSAHYLCLDARNAIQGVMSKGEFSTQSKSVGAVSESYAIPEKFLKNPVLSYYTKTGYGQKYLAIITPLLVGNMGIAYGATVA